MDLLGNTWKACEEVGRGEKDSHWWCGQGYGFMHRRGRFELEHGEAAEGQASFDAQERRGERRAAWLRLDSGREAATGCGTTEENKAAKERKMRTAGRAASGEGSRRQWYGLFHAET